MTRIYLSEPEKQRLDRNAEYKAALGPSLGDMLSKAKRHSEQMRVKTRAHAARLRTSHFNRLLYSTVAAALLCGFCLGIALALQFPYVLEQWFTK